jgi:hypothetical protein
MHGGGHELSGEQILACTQMGYTLLVARVEGLVLFDFGAEFFKVRDGRFQVRQKERTVGHGSLTSLQIERLSRTGRAHR